MSYRILVADDDIEITKIVRGYLEQAGFLVLVAHDGDTALHVLRRERPDVMILDILMPRRDGWEVMGVVRQDATLAATPIMLLTARVADSDKILGLELGADDYLTKPFNAHEVVARVRALLRRSQLTQAGLGQPKVLLRGYVQLDIDARSVAVQGEMIDVTPTEFKLLHLLMDNPRHVLTRDELIEKVLGYNYEGMGRALDTHIRNLRKKLARDKGTELSELIQTVYGVGYRWGGEI